MRSRKQEFYTKTMNINHLEKFTCKKRPAWKKQFLGGSTNREQYSSSVSRNRAKNEINCKRIKQPVFHDFTSHIGYISGSTGNTGLQSLGTPKKVSVINFSKF
jgi:hypothetical protein